MKRFVVIGLGNFGAALARSLHGQGHDVAALDIADDAVDRVAAQVDRAAVGDGTSLSVLERLGAASADAGIVSTGDDIAASVLATLALRDLGVREVFVKVISADHARVMDKLGVTETIFPEREAGERLATRLAASTLLNYVPLGKDFGIQDMAVPESWIGRSLKQLDLRRRHAISVVAVHDVLLDVMLPVPDPDRLLRESDSLLVAGTARDLAKAARVH
jgi:trk system potassium uptake protein